MKLKTIIDNLSDVGEPLRAYYAAREDGKWGLQHDGDSKLAEFRDNNRTLNNKLAELEAKHKPFEGMDATATKAALAKLAIFDGIDPEEYKTLKARPDLSQRVTALETQLADARKRSDTAVFRSKVGDIFVRTGGRPDALDFIITKAAEVFTLENGQLTTKQFSVDRPGEPLTIDEWVGAQALSSAFAFKPSSGGGANGGGSRTPGKPTISSGDPIEFGRNIERIAKGEVTVS